MISGLGIDIYGGGVTTNDLNDADGGPNDVQNFPVLGSALTFGTTTTIQGRLNSIANSVFRVEFFSSATADGTTNPATTADNDYSAVIHQVLTFIPNGPLTQTVTVNVAGDSKFERNETFFVNLSGPPARRSRMARDWARSRTMTWHPPYHSARRIPCRKGMWRPMTARCRLL